MCVFLFQAVSFTIQAVDFVIQVVDFAIQTVDFRFLLLDALVHPVHFVAALRFSQLHSLLLLRGGGGELIIQLRHLRKVGIARHIGREAHGHALLQHAFHHLVTGKILQVVDLRCRLCLRTSRNLMKQRLDTGQSQPIVELLHHTFHHTLAL